MIETGKIKWIPKIDPNLLNPAGYQTSFIDQSISEFLELEFKMKCEPDSTKQQDLQSKMESLLRITDARFEKKKIPDINKIESLVEFSKN